MTRVGQNHIYTVYIRYFWQGDRQIYGHIRCIYTVLANPTYDCEGRTFLMRHTAYRTKNQACILPSPRLHCLPAKDQQQPMVARVWARMQTCTCIRARTHHIHTHSHTDLQEYGHACRRAHADVHARTTYTHTCTHITHTHT